MRPRVLPLALLLPLVGCSALHPAAPATPDAAVLVLVNRADVAVRYVYLSPCDSGEWGEDRLGESEVVMPWQSRSFELDPGCWDARAVLSDERNAEERGITLTRRSQRTWTVTEDGEQ